MKSTNIMWDYIRGEQAALSRMLDGKVLFEYTGSLPQMDAIYIVTRGSSFDGAVVMSDSLSRCMNARVHGYMPVGFTRSCHSSLCEDRRRCMVVVVSQTGTNRGLLETAIHTRELGFAMAGITQVTDSPISRLADRCLYLGCGGENSNAKTEGYNSTLLALMIMGIGYGQKYGSMDQESCGNILEELWLCVEQLDRTMERTMDWYGRYREDQKMRDLYVLGTGVNYSTAMEGQLKLMGTAYTPTTYSGLEEFSYRMHRSIGRGSGVLLLCTNGIYRELAMEAFSYLLGMTEKVLVLYTGNEDIGCKESHEKVLKLDRYPLTRSVLLITMAVQVLSVFMPEALRQDPNRTANDDYADFAHTRVTQIGFHPWTGEKRLIRTFSYGILRSEGRIQDNTKKTPRHDHGHSKGGGHDGCEDPESTA